MQFKLLSLLASAAALVSANTITFKSLDSTSRTVYFTGNPGMATIQPTRVPGSATIKVDIPEHWQGNFYSVSDGAPNVPGMLGEVAFQSWAGITFFDVSAIVAPQDHDGVKQLWPASSVAPISGCERFPCAHAYYLPDDVQTKATSESDLICTLGNGALTAREFEDDESPVFERAFVMGKWSSKL